MKEKEKILVDQAWEQMESILDAHMPVKKKRLIGLWWWIGLSALVITSTLAYFMLSDNDVKEKSGMATADAVYATNNLKREDVNAQINADIENEEVNQNKLVNQELNGIDHNSESLKLAKEKQELITAKSFEINNSNPIDNNRIEPEQSFNNIAKEKVSREIPDSIFSIGIDDQLSINEKSGVEKDLAEGMVNDNLEINAKDEEVNLLKNQIRTPIVSIVNIPVITNIGFNSLVEKKDIENQSKIIPVTSPLSGVWRFGVFTSYQYIDKYFTGFDLGLEATYECNYFGIGAKFGIERLRNSSEQVLQNAAIGVSSTPSTTLLQSSRSAGFELNDLILEKNNFLAEFNLSYSLPWHFNVATGIGYKRLLNVTTRSISGFVPDDMSNADFDPESSSNELLDGTEVIDNPSVNRNRFYLPIELRYRPFKYVQVGVGSQLFLNNVFEDFDEKNRSLYARVSIAF